MKVLILGASGGIGTQLLRMASEGGHTVTALSRRPLGVLGVRTVEGDVLSDEALEAAVSGQDAVLSALGIRRHNQPNPWSRLASPADLTTRTARALVRAMNKHGVKRVIAVSAAGVGDSRPGLNLMMRFFIRYTNIGANYRDLAGMEDVFRASNLDWCCVRPVGLKDGPVTGRVQQIASFPFGAWISRADVADWMVKHLDVNLEPIRTPVLREAVR